MSEEFRKAVGQEAENTLFLRNLSYSEEKGKVVVRKHKRTQLQKKDEPIATIKAGDCSVILDDDGNIHYEFKSKEEMEI